MSVLILLSCSEVKQKSPKIEIPIIEDNLNVSDDDYSLIQFDTNIQKEWDKSLYQNKLKVYGVEKDYALSILQEINPIYFDDLNYINFIYSNPDYRVIKGIYYPNNREITIYVYDLEWKPYYKYLTLHELKHHWCWINKQEITLNHQGCFLNTSIDKEYGFI